MNYTTKSGARALKALINEYFAECDRVNLENTSKIIKPYTLSGLLCHLGLSRQELSELEEEGAASRIILAAKLKIEAFIEENTLSGKLAGTAAINTLKCNFGWNDKHENEVCRSFSILLEDEADELGA